MRSFSGIGLGLSLVFGCLLLALIAELYYLLWWKKKRITDSRDIEDEYGNFAKELFHFICWKTPNNPSSSTTTAQSETPHQRKPDTTNGNSLQDHQDPEMGKERKDEYGNGIESELMRLHGLAGPPRFLFTIKEETREDLESDDGRSRRGSRTRSLSDLMLVVNAVDSPRRKSPPPANPTAVMSDNPLFESSAELARLRSSPPPKFKFLRDAEEKLYRRLIAEAEKRNHSYSNSNNNININNNDTDNSKGAFTFAVGSGNLPNYPSGSSQVLPLGSSPSAFKVQTHRV